MLDFGIILKLKQVFAEFKANNPELMDFASKIKSKGFYEGQQVKITVTYPDGTQYDCDMTVDKDDLKTLNTLTSLKL